MDLEDQTQRQLEEFRQRIHVTANFYRKAIVVLAADQLVREAQPNTFQRPNLLRACGDWAVRLGRWGLGKLAPGRRKATVISTRPEAPARQIIVIEQTALTPSSRKGESDE